MERKELRIRQLIEEATDQRLRRDVDLWPALYSTLQAGQRPPLRTRLMRVAHHFQKANMSTRLKYVGLLVAAATLLTAGTVTAASMLLKVRDPETPVGPPGPSGIVPPRLMPPANTDCYRDWPSGAVVTAKDGRPIAQLAEVPGRLGEAVAACLPDQRPAEMPLSYAVLATIRYTGGGHTVSVSTARPSPEAAKLEQSLGDRTVKLADGSKAWANTDMRNGLPNQIVLVRGDLIITVASDLSLEEIMALAEQVVVKP